MWSEDSRITFNDNISDDKLNTIMLDIYNNSIPVDTCVKNIEELFINAANSTFGPEYVIEVGPKRSCKPKFSKETIVKKNIYNIAKRRNKRKFRNANTLNNVTVASREYKKAVRYEKSKEILIRNKRFRSKNVKDRRYFWSMLSKKNKNSKIMPNLNSCFNSFKNLASGEEQGEYIFNDANETIIIDQEAEIFLDSEFTSDEIDKMVSNLKNKKSMWRGWDFK